MTPNAALEKTREIHKLRQIVSLVRDTPSKPSTADRLRAMVRKIRPALRALACIRYAFSPLKSHDWCVVFDGGRAQKKDTETYYDFLNRVGRTNRSDRLPAFLGLTPSSRIVAIDMTQSVTCHNGAYGTLPYLFASAGITGLPHLILDVVQGAWKTKSPQLALIYAGLRLVGRTSHKSKNGLLMTTSISWLAEVLRVGLSNARSDLDIVEVLHGAGTQNTGPYFQWVHDQAQAPIRYINLIADLPRYAPLKHNMVRDAEGEIACNIRLWQGRSDNKVSPPDALRTHHNVVFIGGASIDAHYASSSFFQKELDMLAALKAHTIGPVFYAFHPVHSTDLMDEMRTQLVQYDVQILTHTTLEMILGASIVVGGLSTSLIEAALLDVPSFAYEDFNALFVPETADLVTWNTDFMALARQISDTYQTIVQMDKTEHIAHTKEQALRRCGLQVVL